jgi:hypothetical protein
LLHRSRHSRYIFTREHLDKVKNHFPSLESIKNSLLTQSWDKTLHGGRDEISRLNYFYRMILAFSDEKFMMHLLMELTVSLKVYIQLLQDVIDVTGLLPEMEDPNSIVVCCDNIACRREIFEGYILCPTCGYMCLHCASHCRCSSKAAKEACIVHSRENIIDGTYAFIPDEENSSSSDQGSTGILPGSTSRASAASGKSNDRDIINDLLDRIRSLTDVSVHAIESSIGRHTDVDNSNVHLSSEPDLPSYSKIFNDPRTRESLTSPKWSPLIKHASGAKLLCKSYPWQLKKSLIELITIIAAKHPDMSLHISSMITKVHLDVRKNADMRYVCFLNILSFGNVLCNMTLHVSMLDAMDR